MIYDRISLLILILVRHIKSEKRNSQKYLLQITPMVNWFVSCSDIEKFILFRTINWR